METNSFFNINRLKLLVLRDFGINYKTMLIATAAVGGFLMFIGTLTIIFGEKSMNQQNILGMVMPTLIIMGLISTSMVFSELHSPHKGYIYLTLPASAFEKLIAAWLVSSVFYVIFSMALLLFLNVYYILIALLFSSQSVELVNIFSPEVLKPLGVYMVVQSGFLLGAIYFRKVNFLKTILAFFVLNVLIAIYVGVLGKILFGHFGINSNDFNKTFELKASFENQIVPIAKPI